MDGWCRQVEHVDSEQEVPNWFRQIGATDPPRFVGDKGKQGPPDWVIRYEGNTIAVEVTLLRDEKKGWPRAMEMGIENKLCELVEKVSWEHGSPLAWQVSCEYAPEQPRRTMRTGKWATGDHDHDGDRKSPDALLMREPLVHRDEDPEPVVGREAHQFSVRAPSPTHLLHRARSERLGERRREPPWNGFVQQHLHLASPTSCAVTRASSLTACSLLTVG